MKEVRIGDVVERAIERADYPPERLKSILGGETIAVLGYGVQGRAQAQNLRDRGFSVVVGQRAGPSYDLARADGWVPGTTLFSLEDAASRGTLLLMLLSDAGQKDAWPRIASALSPGKGLIFAHGFAIVYSELTGVVPPPDVDVLLVAPRGSGTTLRRDFLNGRGLNASYAVRQDATGRGRDRALALGVAIGAAHLFETSFENEVRGDLTGERGTLLGAIYGLWLAQYEVLRERGHPPCEAFQETVEEATQSLYPLIAEKGLDWMYANCSTTAQRGALDWYRRFRDAVKPVFAELYESVARGEEARRALEANARAGYRAELEGELRAIAESEMWRAGAVVRSLRPEGRTE